MIGHDSWCNTIEVVGAKRWPPSEQGKSIPLLRYVLPPLTKNPGYVAGHPFVNNIHFDFIITN